MSYFGIKKKLKNVTFLFLKFFLESDDDGLVGICFYQPILN